MKVYRISKTEYADNLTGTGAALYGGRWNPKGFSVVYTAGSISLAILEFMAHNLQLIPNLSLTLSVIEISEPLEVKEVQHEDLPPRWSKPFQSQRFTQGLGAEFLKAKRAYAMKVPSALVPLEFNLLLNPTLPDHQSTRIIHRIENFKIDERLYDL